jgi:CubicO group peptidase (beta-lactamase class C family)
VESQDILKAMPGLDDFVSDQLQRWKVPGVAVAVVKDGEVWLARGYGLRDLERGLPMTGRTLLAIGSCTKAFTTTAIAMLVEDGKLDWDEPVHRYLPQLRLKDPWASARVTLRDMGCHRTGLPRYDIMLFNPALSREDIVSSLEHLEPRRDFRTSWQYQNLMYATMGYVAGKVAGSTWEDLVRERILRPLGMTESNFSVGDSQAAEDFALPYGKREDRVERVEFLEIGATGPAGSINSNAEEMARWVMLNLDQGKYGDRSLISPAGLTALFSPQMMLPQGQRYPELAFSSYGLGWATNTYRGHTVVHHGGGTAGFTAQVCLVPARRTGVVVLANLSGSQLPDIITNYILDCLLGLEPIDWSGRYQELVSQMEQARTKQDETLRLARRAGTSPTHSLQEYAGVYRHPAAGVLTIALKDQVLTGKYGIIDLAITHHHYDTFEVKFAVVGSAMTMLANFATDTLGRVCSVTIPLGLESGAQELVFTRAFDPSVADDPGLYTGEYELAGITITVEVRETTNTLVMTMPGQPSTELVPAGSHTFELKGPKGLVGGVRVHFNVSGEKAESLILAQPAGAYTARRK